ncbi:DUF6436 domain-containing protein [Alteromonas flava]|uniref:DUF6436 domain-containing protein n=1 Tax=Alteromonas flava TaxID=2048003 RepID=UPI000C28F931|nr:DUF6436 domain-containing protein [Alteromonas flava]
MKVEGPAILASLWVVIIALVWLLGIGVLMAGFSARQLITFDQNGELLTQIERLDAMTFSLFNDTSLIEASAKTVLHIKDNECMCQWVAASHIASVERLATEQGFKNISFTAAEAEALGLFVPAVPAVAVISAEQKLLYFGPYSAGLYCSAGNGIVESFIESTPERSIGATIPVDAEGCYCPVQRA